MKKLILLAGTLAAIATTSFAQPCATSALTSSSSNAFTNIRNATNAIAVDNDLNTIVYIHRNNAGVFGGHSGQLRYDISTDDGSTWSTNLGVLNPLSVNGTNGARYPQIAIHNPAGNTVPNNAYLSYQAATVAATFNGIVSGVRKLDGTGNTETYNQPAATQTLIPNSMVEGAPGIFWSIDEVYNGSSVTGFRVFKGVWNGSTDVVWSTNATLTPPFNLAFNGLPQVGDYHIAFDPTGQMGWISILTHLTGGPSPYSFYPVFYRTTDGGNTWSAPMQVDLGQFNCITSNITVGNFASAAFESDLTVDVNGEPHLLTTVCNGNNAYAIFFTSWHHMFDITYHFGLWNAIDVANVNAGRGTWGTAPNTATMDNQPMVSRTADGTKIFFAWSDNAGYALGAANQTPNLFSKAYDVTTSMWTGVRDFTSCNGAINGLILFPKLAAEVIEPSAGTYKLAAIYTQLTIGDPLLTINISFLNNMTWANADFTTPQVFATVNINEGSTWLLCPGSTLGLSVTGSYNQVLWSTGAVTLATTINAPGIYTVAVRSGCIVGIDTIVVTGATATITAGASSLCPGDSTQMVVNGNALNYLWNPSGSTNDSIMAVPASTTTYTVTAGGDGGCTFTATSTIIVHPQPIVAATSSAAAVCDGDSATLSATGGTTYTWQPGNMNGASINVTPTATSTYTVTGTDVNGCIDVDSVSVTFNPLPVITATADTLTICAGDTATLSASGAATYSWTPSATLGTPTNPTTTAFPGSPTTYVVNGIDVNGCMSSDSIAINVNALPTVVASHSGTFCETDTVFFTAVGASTYLWMPGNLVGANVVDFPAAGQNNYWVTGTDSNGCSATDSFLVFINANPIVTANGQTPICEGAQAVLSGNGASTYFWIPINVTGSPIMVAPTTTTTYSVTGTDLNGCFDTASFTIVVNPLPVVTLSIPGSPMCLDDAAISLVGTGSPAGGTFSGNGVTGTTFTPMSAGVGAQNITYTYVDANGCTDSASFAVLVNACVGMNEYGVVISNLYPNPFGGQVILETTTSGETQVIVHSLLGQEIMNTEFTGDKLVIETSTWPAGVYLFTVNTSVGQQTVRLVKD